MASRSCGERPQPAGAAGSESPRPTGPKCAVRAVGQHARRSRARCRASCRSAANGRRRNCCRPCRRWWRARRSRCRPETTARDGLSARLRSSSTMPGSTDAAPPGDVELEDAVEIFRAVDHQRLVDRLPALRGAAAARPARVTPSSRASAIARSASAIVRGSDHAERHHLVVRGVGRVAAAAEAVEQDLARDLAPSAAARARAPPSPLRHHVPCGTFHRRPPRAPPSQASGRGERASAMSPSANGGSRTAAVTRVALRKRGALTHRRERVRKQNHRLRHTATRYRLDTERA